MLAKELQNKVQVMAILTRNNQSSRAATLLLWLLADALVLALVVSWGTPVATIGKGVTRLVDRACH